MRGLKTSLHPTVSVPQDTHKGSEELGGGGVNWADRQFGCIIMFSQGVHTPYLNSDCSLSSQWVITFIIG